MKLARQFQHANSPSSGPRGVLAPAAGLAIVCAITAFDTGGRSVVIGTVVLGAFVTALIGTARQTALVAAVALVCAVISAAWNDNFADAPYLLRALVVAAG